MVRKSDSSETISHKTFFDSLAKQIRRLRVEKNISHEDFATRSNLLPKERSDIEKGKFNPTITTLLAISRALDCSLKELLDF